MLAASIKQQAPLQSLYSSTRLHSTTFHKIAIFMLFLFGSSRFGEWLRFFLVSAIGKFSGMQNLCLVRGIEGLWILYTQLPQFAGIFEEE
jgi:hypothetical protein